MKPRPSLLARLAAIFRRRPVVKPAPMNPTPAPKEPKVRSIEPLEGRISPATLVNAQMISFTDLDGDLVTVHFSKAILTSSNVSEIFKFSNGTQASPFSDSGGQQLQLIDLNRVPVNLDTFISRAEGLSVTVTAAKDGLLGDDLTRVGAVKATGIALGSVTIDGDLGQIDCGRGGAKVGLKSLVVESVHKFGEATQLLTGTPQDRLESRILGELSNLEVKTDMHGYIHATDGNSFVGNNLVTTAPAKIAKAKIGGFLRGGSLDNSGSIVSDRNISTIEASGLIGGSATNTGSIIAKAGLGTVKVTGEMLGGAGTNSAGIQAVTLSKATIGDLIGGGGDSSGAVKVAKTIGSLTVTDDVTGGGGLGSGSIQFGSVIPVAPAPGALPGALPTTITIGDDVTGGSGFLSGSIYGNTSLAIVKVAGDVTGGTADRSGSIISDGTISIVSVGKLVGGAGENSGSIFGGADPLLKGNVGTVTIANGMVGGTGISSGSIIASKIGLVRVGTALQSASIVGGDGDFSGSIFSTSTMRLIEVYGSVIGSTGDHSGAIESRGIISTVKITANLTGGGGEFSGALRAEEVINDDFTGIAAGFGVVTIGGNITGSTGVNSGRVESSGNISSITVGSLNDGAGLGSGEIVAGAGFLGSGGAGVVKVVGAVESTISVRGKLTKFSAGSLNDASVLVGRDIVSAVVNGNVTGSTISAVGQAVVNTMLGDLAIAKLTIKGNVTDSQILAGYDQSGTGLNADASIGPVSVTGNWTASDLVAGVQDVNADGFGNADDTKITIGINRAALYSKIASVVIGGTVTGTATGGDNYGFTAQRILAFKSGGVATVLTPGSGNDDKPLGATGDVKIHEVPL